MKSCKYYELFTMRFVAPSFMISAVYVQNVSYYFSTDIGHKRYFFPTNDSSKLKFIIITYHQNLFVACTFGKGELRFSELLGVGIWKLYKIFTVLFDFMGQIIIIVLESNKRNRDD